MTPDKYKALRESIGTQAAVAARLNVARSTIADRERGDMVITREAASAMLWLVTRDEAKAIAAAGKPDGLSAAQYLRKLGTAAGALEHAQT